MGSVLLVYEIRPESPEIKPEDIVEKIRANLPQDCEMKEHYDKKPLFFGIVGIVAQFIIPERDGAQDELEDYLNSIEGVSSIQMTYVTRL
ncbi:MAG: elongation factor 1-beta [Candidatus Heimdallarchaeaceae archaeon]